MSEAAERLDEDLDDLPHCGACGHLLRPDVVWFEEMLPPGPWHEAELAAQSCDCFLVVGTSAVVYPAAGLVPLARAHGARVIEVNLVAPYLVCHAVVPHMIKAKYGRIVNIASIAGKEGNPNASHYSASKAGLIGLTKSLGKELATKGILVNCITPAAAKTEMFGQMTQQHIDYMLSKIPMDRFVLVEELAAMIAWLASEDCSFSTGAVFDVSGGRATY